MENKPICYVPGREIPEIFSGTPTFLGLPKIATPAELAAHDVVVMGVPWEGVCTYGGYTACELSTKIIREASIRYGGYLPDYDLDVFDYFSGGDYGDCPVQNGNHEFTFEQIRRKFAQIMTAEKISVVFGGDHSISYPLISEYAKFHKRDFGIIHFDAHMDNMAAYGEEKYARCSPLHRLYEDENVSPANIVHFGIRGPRNNPAGLATAREHGSTVITGMEVKRLGWETAISNALEIACKGVSHLYVTVCSDILDIAHNPAGPPDPCGMTTFELAMMLHACGKAGANAFDFVELYPGQDPNNTSAHNAVWMTIYFLAGVVKNRFNLTDQSS